MSSPSDQELAQKLGELASSEAWQRAQFLMELGWSRAEQPTPGLRPFLEDPAPVVRIAAAQAVWQTNQNPADLDRVVAVLVGGLCLEDQDEELPLMAGTALVQMDGAAVGPLIRQFKNRGGKDPLIVRVIGEIADPEALEFLSEAAQSRLGDVAREAKFALEAVAP